MEIYDYLILGGGMTAAAAVKGIREVDTKGRIGILTAEEHAPYKRPPLSKKLWQGKPESIVWSDLADDVEVIVRRRAMLLNWQQKQVRDDAGEVYGYQKLLLATGGRPRRLPLAPEGIVYFRTLDDYRILRSWTGHGARFGVIGGGFIGSEIAAALNGLGEQVVMVFPEEGIGARIFPGDLSRFITHHYREKGVEVLSGVEVQSVESRGDGFLIHSSDGMVISVDHLVAGIGLLPNIDLARQAGIALAEPEEGGGILVDDHLRTNRMHIYAAGDVASFYNFPLQRRMRVEHADNANTMGYIAGLNMAGEARPYHHLPFFYGDLFDLGYEAVGELDPRHEILTDWITPFEKGVLYYLNERKLRGVLLWNVWDQVDAARELIAAGRPYSPHDLAGRIPGK